MNKYVEAFIEKFSQESTWRGLVAVCAAFGAVMEPDKANAIVAAGMAIIGTINIAKDK